MVTRIELEAMLADIESDRVDRTASVSNTDKFCQAICAFANDFPNRRQAGYLIVGANDNGTLSGLTVTDQLLQSLAGIRSDGNIQPLPSLVVEKFSFASGEVAVVEVQPSDLPPVRYKGRVYIRVGPRRAVASEQEERLLSEKRVSFARSFDASPCMEATKDDLALGVFEAYRASAVAADVIEANHRTMEEQLASLRLFTLATNTPTFAGILLAGKNPRYFLPGAYIQFLRMPGNDLAEMPEDQAEISGDMLSVLREVDARARITNTKSLRSLSLLRQETVGDYPDGALRELLMNAIVHRSYESNTPIRFYWFLDRIEIHNPGGLYDGVTESNYWRTNSYRNPVLAEAMKNLGYVNRYGVGIQIAQNLLKQNKNPEAEFVFQDHFVLVTLRRRAL